MTKYTLNQHIFCLFFIGLQFSGYFSSTIFISQNDHSMDVPGCGTEYFPCQSIGYALNTKNLENITVILDGGNHTDHAYLYHINSSITVNTDMIFQSRSTAKPLIKAGKELYDNKKLLFVMQAGKLHMSHINFERFYQFTNLSRASACLLQFHNCIFQDFDYLIFQFETVDQFLLVVSDSLLINFNYVIRTLVPMNITIMNSTFSSNRQLVKDNRIFRLNAIIIESTTVNLTMYDSVFRGLTRAIKIIGSQHTGTDSTVGIYYSSFLYNCVALDLALTKIDGYESNVYIYGAVHVTISHSYFNGNIAMKGGALVLDAFTRVEMSHTVFMNNSAVYEGGALLSNAFSLSLYQCLFLQNFLDPTLYIRVIPPSREQLPTLKDGGAIKNFGNMTIRSCTFVNNYSPAFGGSIFHTSSKGIQNEPMIIYDSVFYGGTQNLSYVGCLLYANSALGLSNVTFNVINALNYGSVFYYYDVFGIISSDYRVTPFSFAVNCPVNYQMTSEKVRSSHDIYYSLIYFCSQCKKGTYSVEREAERFDMKIFPVVQKTSMTCHQCPVGGRCDEGIVSNDNFFGFITSSNAVEFINCPPNYCCSTYNAKCLSYNTCNFNREGQLCGQCKAGYSENLLSTRCIPNEKCGGVLFWCLSFTGSVVYLLVIIYLKEITNFLKRSLETPGKKTRAQEVLLECDTTGSHLDTEYVLDDCESDFQQDKQQKLCIYNNADSSSYIASGVLKIVVFFYQIEILLQVNSGTKRHYKTFTILKDIMMSVINFQPAFSSRRNNVGFELCPYPKMKPVLKEFFKIALIGFIFLLLFVVSLIRYCVSRRRNKAVDDDGDNDKDDGDDKPVIEFVDACIHKYQKIPFTLRLKCGFLQLILITYTPIITFMFRVINCVTLNNTKVLYINGEVRCYQWWQNICGVILGIWILPLTLTLYWSIDLLKNCKIRPNEFLRDLAFPPITFYHYIKSKFYRTKTFLTLHEAKSTKHLLMVFSDPFREKYAKWEGMIMFRKIVLVISAVFIINPVVRLYVMLFLLTLFLVIHLRVQPYKGPFLNWLETTVLITLCLMSSLNLFWAEGYLYEIVPQSKLLGEVFVFVEVIILALPVFMATLFLIVVLVKKIYRCCF